MCGILLWKGIHRKYFKLFLTVNTTIYHYDKSFHHLALSNTVSSWQTAEYFSVITAIIFISLLRSLSYQNLTYRAFSLISSELYNNLLARYVLTHLSCILSLLCMSQTKLQNVRCLIVLHFRYFFLLGFEIVTDIGLREATKHFLGVIFFFLLLFFYNLPH